MTTACNAVVFVLLSPDLFSLYVYRKDNKAKQQAARIFCLRQRSRNQELTSSSLPSSSDSRPSASSSSPEQGPGCPSSQCEISSPRAIGQAASKASDRAPTAYALKALPAKCVASSWLWVGRFWDRTYPMTSRSSPSMSGREQAHRSEAPPNACSS